MARNRRNQSAAIRFGPALKALLLCLLIGGSGVGYVWQKTQIYQLDRQIRFRERLLIEVQASNAKLLGQLLVMRSPGWLDERAKRLGLGQPQPEQIWCLPEPVAQSWQGTRTYAAQTQPVVHTQ
jgi:hypothetical protein